MGGIGVKVGDGVGVSVATTTIATAWGLAFNGIGEGAVFIAMSITEKVPLFRLLPALAT